jgi:predicted GNAT family N-acyltransferase
MISIRQININDDFDSYMECIQDLNSNGVELCDSKQIKNDLARRNNNIITYVIVLSDKIVATATCIFEKKLRYSQLCCHIEDVSVHANFRNQRFGKTIIDYCISIARSKRCYKVKLCCSNELEPFYRGMGFKKSSLGMEKSL